MKRETREVARHRIPLGRRHDGQEVTFYPARQNLLLAGTSGSGKSTLAAGLLERLAKRGYQFCVIDPEGDYEVFTEAIVLGTVQRGPGINEILTALSKSDNSVVINLVGLPLQDRPTFFLGLLPRLQELRAKTGRPHWILVDESHHLMPIDWDPTVVGLAKELSGMIYVTVHPDQLERSVLETIDIVIALGDLPNKTMASYYQTVGHPVLSVPDVTLPSGEAIMWERTTTEPPFKLLIMPSEFERRRHRRKYAEGELPPDRCFYFRGPAGTLNLRAQNLILFAQIAEGIDDQTWDFHLRRGDYSRWFMEIVKDDELAEVAHNIERRTELSPTESRRLIQAVIEERYTIPAKKELTGKLLHLKQGGLR